MSNFYGKAPSSRPTVYQVVQLSSAVAVNSASFSAQTFQIRVQSSIAAYFTIGTSTAAATFGSAGSASLAANSPPEMLTVTPGQQISLIALSSASTGTVSVVEMS